MPRGWKAWIWDVNEIEKSKSEVAGQGLSKMFRAVEKRIPTLKKIIE